MTILTILTEKYQTKPRLREKEEEEARKLIIKRQQEIEKQKSREEIQERMKSWIENKKSKILDKQKESEFVLKKVFVLNFLNSTLPNLT